MIESLEEKCKLYLSGKTKGTQRWLCCKEKIWRCKELGKVWEKGNLETL